MTMAVRRDAAVTPRNEGGEGLGPCHSGDLLQPPSPPPAPLRHSERGKLTTATVNSDVCVVPRWRERGVVCVYVWTAADIFQISDV